MMLCKMFTLGLNSTFSQKIPTKIEFKLQVDLKIHNTPPTFYFFFFDHITHELLTKVEQILLRADISPYYAIPFAEGIHMQ